jgi:hypothetical protein
MIGDDACRALEDLSTPAAGRGYARGRTARPPAAVPCPGAQSARPPIAMEYGAVASEDRPGEQTDAPQGGVFGNLPDSRPGTRSPRRDAASDERTRRSTPRAKAAGTRTKQRPSRPAPRRPSPEPKPRASADPPEPEREGRAAEGEPAAGGGLEDLAWAGIAAAAEAATIGVRLASRAMEALRKPVDRR